MSLLSNHLAFSTSISWTMSGWFATAARTPGTGSLRRKSGSVACDSLFNVPRRSLRKSEL
jgi:hypothetical protein